MSSTSLAPPQAAQREELVMAIRTGNYALAGAERTWTASAFAWPRGTGGLRWESFFDIVGINQFAKAQKNPGPLILSLDRRAEPF